MNGKHHCCQMLYTLIITQNATPSGYLVEANAKKLYHGKQ